MPGGPLLITASRMGVLLSALAAPTGGSASIRRSAQTPVFEQLPPADQPRLRDAILHSWSPVSAGSWRSPCLWFRIGCPHRARHAVEQRLVLPISSFCATAPIALRVAMQLQILGDGYGKNGSSSGSAQ